MKQDGGVLALVGSGEYSPQMQEFESELLHRAISRGIALFKSLRLHLMKEALAAISGNALGVNKQNELVVNGSTYLFMREKMPLTQSL